MSVHRTSSLVVAGGRPVLIGLSVGHGGSFLRQRAAVRSGQRSGIARGAARSARSAAPRSGASMPRGDADHDRHRRARERERARIQLVGGPWARDSGAIRPNRPPRTTTWGSKMLTSPASPMPSQRAQRRGPRHRRRLARLRPRAARRPPRPARHRGRGPRRRSRARSPTSVSQQPREPQPQVRAVRLDRDVADLAGVAARRPPAGGRR